MNNQYKITFSLFFLTCLSFGSGYVKEKIYTENKKPCVENFQIAWGYGMQRMLERDDIQFMDSDMTVRDVALSSIEKSNEEGSEVKIHTNHNGVEYYVPSYCYVEETMIKTVLWRK
jgi:hypothetical protein